MYRISGSGWVQTDPSDLARSNWLPTTDSLGGPLGEIRQFSSFRAYLEDADPDVMTRDTTAGGPFGLEHPMAAHRAREVTAFRIPNKDSRGGLLGVSATSPLHLKRTGALG